MSPATPQRPSCGLPLYARLGFVVFLVGAATAADLVRDINTVPVADSQALSGFVNVGSWTAFVLDDGIHGAELWRSDGTPQGTSLVLDINPGQAASYPTSLTPVGNVLYFLADDGTNGRELWRSDGTAAGTRIVADINPGSASAPLALYTPLQVMKGVVYFAATEPSAGPQLWRSDGTASGTYRVTNIRPTPGAQPSLNLVGAIGAQLFVVAVDKNGEELWCTDGTPGGTHVVAYDASALTNLDGFGSFVTTNAGLYYTRPVRDPNFPDTPPQDILTTLWYADPAGQHTAPIESYSSSLAATIAGIAPFSDGIILVQTVRASAGTAYGVYRISGNGSPMHLADVPANTMTGPVQFAAYGSRLLFTTVDTAYGLWSSDGTAAGTRQLAAAANLHSVFPLFGALAVGAGGVFFYAMSGSEVDQYDIWRSDGTEAGTYLYAALATGQTSDLTEFNGKIYFAGGWSGATGWEPWVSDGTVAGTHLLADLIPGPGDSAPGLFTVIGDRMYFAGESNEAASLLYVSDGTTAGTALLAPDSQPARGRDSNPHAFLAFGKQVLFASDTWSSIPLWATDGTTAGTNDLNAPFAISSEFFASTPASLGLVLVFWADDPAHGAEPWVTDGTPSGTHLLLDINPGSADSLNPLAGVGMAVVGKVAYFTADDGVHGNELWRTDGSAAGTYMVADTVPGPGAARLGLFLPFNGQLLFMDDGNWWISDGTAAGTHIITSVVAIDPSVSPVILGNIAYFAGSGPGAVEQLWRTDGTAEGTVQVSNLAPGASKTLITQLYATSARVIFDFNVSAPSASYGLYSSDGTAGGTQLINADKPQQGPDYRNFVQSPVALGAQLYYSIDTGTYRAVHVTDGTAAGTAELMRFPNGFDPALGHFTVAHGKMLFNGTDPILGPVVWRTDGTFAGTGLLSVIAPDADRPSGEMFPLGKDVLLAASRPKTGYELYAIRGSGPYAGDDTASTPAGQAVTIQVLTNDGTLGPPLQPATVTVASAPGYGTATAMGDGTIQYVPDAGRSGVDQFRYTVADVNSQVSQPATVSVIVARPAGPAPAPGPSDPGGGGGGGSGSGSGGGGELDLVALAALLVLARHRRKTFSNVPVCRQSACTV